MATRFFDVAMETGTVFNEYFVQTSVFRQDFNGTRLKWRRIDRLHPFECGNLKFENNNGQLGDNVPVRGSMNYRRDGALTRTNSQDQVTLPSFRLLAVSSAIFPRREENSNGAL